MWSFKQRYDVYDYLKKVIVYLDNYCAYLLEIVVNVSNMEKYRCVLFCS